MTSSVSAIRILQYYWVPFQFSTFVAQKSEPNTAKARIHIKANHLSSALTLVGIGLKNGSSFILLLCLLAVPVFGQTPAQVSFDKLMDFGQVAFPDLLTPPTATQQIDAAGSTWFYRDYGYLSPIAGDTGLIVSVNITGGGGFNAGDVYAVGGAYGEVPIRIDTLTNLLTLVPDSTVGPDESGMIDPGNGNCVSLVRPVEGLSPYYITEREAQGTNYNQGGYEIILSNATQITRRGGIDTIINSTTTESAYYISNTFYDVFEGKRFLIEIDTDFEQAIPQPQQYNITKTFEPALFDGPVEIFCEGQQWYSAGVIETATTTPDSELQGPVQKQIPAATTTVNSISESVILPGLGTFTTVKTTSESTAGREVKWRDRGTGVLLQSEEYDANDNLVAKTVLQSLYENI